MDPEQVFRNAASAVVRGDLVVRVRDGDLAKITLYQSPEEALAAAEDD